MILVIGYGNPLCGDDGVGPHVVERLVNVGLPANVEYLTLRQLTPELAEPISRAEAVIFIDAAAGGGTAGSITCRKLEPVATPFETTQGAFTHHIKAGILIESARFLYGRQPAAWLYTVTGEDFNLGNSFSPAVESALPQLLDQLKARMAQCMNLASLKQ
jgi:hydrogenase maturation protease